MEEICLVPKEEIQCENVTGGSGAGAGDFVTGGTGGTVDIVGADGELCESPEAPEAPVVPSGKFVSKGEKECCRVMEKIYGKKFTTTRALPWLKNPKTNRNLELDCYNDEIKMAVEYNGIQHYKWPNFTPQSKEEFMDQVGRDDLKRQLCDKNGVYLITVPYWVKDIEKHILSLIPERLKQEHR